MTVESPVRFPDAGRAEDRGGPGDGSALGALYCATMVRALARYQLDNRNAIEGERGAARRAGRQRRMGAGGGRDRIREQWTSGFKNMVMARVGVEGRTVDMGGGTEAA